MLGEETQITQVFSLKDLESTNASEIWAAGRRGVGKRTMNLVKDILS